ncbi:MAG: NAD(P)H-dependent oxidoreductase subunit E [Chloroflexi bacterium]|nr:NAD(P)H-dependent oxidoreductase subunit E [Chloroflexota bacterium]
MRTDRVPGLGIAKGLVFAFTQALRPKRTIQYPEVQNPISPRHRGRLILLYDEAGTLKCETCFQCAAACPIECIDMGGVDTRQRYHLHWGPAEQYAERREESALRRSGRPVPDRTFEPFATIDLAPLDAILTRHDFRPRAAVRILEDTQEAYGYLPVAALQHIAFRTGAWYSELYGIATSYPHLRFEAPTGHLVQVCRCAQCTVLGGGAVLGAFRSGLGADVGGISPDGAVRLEATDCRGSSQGTPRVIVDGQVLPRVDAADATTIAAALRGAVPQGRSA